MTDGTETSLLLELQRATHATLRTLVTELAGFGLDPAEINLLGNLADGVPRAISELAIATGSRPTTLTSVLDRLEARGLVTRERHPRDRRSVLIALTDEGRRAAGAVRDALRAIEDRRLAGMDDRQRAAFSAALRALSEAP